MAALPHSDCVGMLCEFVSLCSYMTDRFLWPRGITPSCLDITVRKSFVYILELNGCRIYCDVFLSVYNYTLQINLLRQRPMEAIRTSIWLARQARKERTNHVNPDNVFQCPHCTRQLRARIGLISHLRTHTSTHSTEGWLKMVFVNLTDKEEEEDTTT